MIYLPSKRIPLQSKLVLIKPHGMHELTPAPTNGMTQKNDEFQNRSARCVELSNSTEFVIKWPERRFSKRYESHANEAKLCDPYSINEAIDDFFSTHIGASQIY